MPKQIKEGVKAPDFSLPVDGGGSISLKECAGSPVVLYFYPKDDTPGCTKEATDFSAAIKKFQKAGAVVIGVSKDSVAQHEKFKKKYGLKVILAADETGKVIESYGVWVEKSMYGRKFMGIERSTFLIDSKGVVANIWRKVRVPGHVEAVLDAVKELT